MGYQSSDIFIASLHLSLTRKSKLNVDVVQLLEFPDFNVSDTTSLLEQESASDGSSN